MKSILLVEDDDSFRTSLRKVLERENYQVFEAASGQEGNDLAMNQKMDLVILDYYLGDMTGADFMDLLPKLTAPPVIVLSANMNDSIQAQVIGRGAKMNLSKPINRATLLQAIETCISDAKGV